MSLNVGELFATLRVDMTQFNANLAQARVALASFGQTATASIASIRLASQEASDSLRRMGETGDEALDEIEDSADDAEKKLNDVGDAGEQGFNRTGRAANIARFIIEGVTVAIGSLVFAMGAITVAGVKMNASAEQSAIAFEALLGSAGRADKMIRDLTEFAKQTPFEYAGLEKVSISLLNAGVKASDLEGVLGNLGDAVSISGGNIQEKMEGVSLAIGQMLSKGKISSEEMQQIAERGIPAWDALADTLGKSVAETRKLVEEGKVASDVIPDLIENIGARGEGAMEMQSQTLTGMLGTLGDTLKQFTKAITKGAFTLIKDEISALITKIEELQGTFEFFRGIILLNQIFTGFVDVIIRFAKWLGIAFANISPDVLYDFLASVKQLKDTLKGLFTGDFITGISEIILIALTAVLDIINTLIPIVGFFLNLIGKILSAGWFQTILKIATIFVGIVKTVALLVTKVLRPLRNVISPILDFFRKTGPEAMTFGQAMRKSFDVIYTAIAGTRFSGALSKIIIFIINFGRFWAKSLKVIFSSNSIITGVINVFRFLAITLTTVWSIVTVLSLALFGNADAWKLIGLSIEYAIYKLEDYAATAQDFVVGMLPFGDQINAGLDVIGIGFQGNTDKIKELEKQMSDLYDSIGQRGEKYQAQLDAQAQEQYLREQKLLEQQKRMEDLIILAKDGSIEAIDELKKAAINGSEEAIIAMAEIDEKFFMNMLNRKKKVLAEMIRFKEEFFNELTEIQMGFTGMTTFDPSNPFAPPIANWLPTQSEFTKNDKTIENLKSQVKLMEQLKNEYGMGVTDGDDGGGGDTRTAAEKLFDSLKEELEYKKSIGQMTVKNEIENYIKWKGIFTKNSADQIKIRKEINATLHQLGNEYLSELDSQVREKIEKDKEFGKLDTKGAIIALQKHYNQLTKVRKDLEKRMGIALTDDAIKSAREELERARLDAIEEELEKEGEERIKLLEEAQQKELDAIEKFYDKKIQMIDDAIEKEKSLFDESINKEKRMELMKELRFLEGSIDKEALERANEIKKELRQMDFDEKIKLMEEEGDEQKKALEEQRKIAVTAKEKQNEEELEKERDYWEKRGNFYKQQALDLDKSISSITKNISMESDKVRKAGSNFVKNLAEGMKEFMPKIKTEVDKLAKMLDVSKMFGDFEKKTSKMFTNIDTSKMSQKVGQLTQQQIVYNAPLLTVDTMNMSDKLDATTLSKEIFNASQNAIRSKGGRIIT